MKKIGIMSLLIISSIHSFGSDIEVTEKNKEYKIPKVIYTYPEKDKEKVLFTEAKDVEIVFVLDTTGSMGGLLEGAKTKVWSIINDVMQNQPEGTKVKVGLVAYRDKGDAYVTKITALSTNLDTVYKDIMEYKAEGGGDNPEDVRKALYQAVNDIKWSKDKKTSRIVFLVGDAPPQEQYGKEQSIDETAKQAKGKGIIINAIQCGNQSETTKYWKSVAQYGGGEYFAISQSGGVTAISTPYDNKLIELNGSLGETNVYYGNKERREIVSVGKTSLESIIMEAPIEAQADRVLNKAINSFSYSNEDLLNSIEINKVNLKDIKTEDLPENMQKMSLKEKEEYIKNLQAERDKVKNEILEISKQRDEYIKEQKKASGDKGDSFDTSVSKALEEQIK